MKQFEVDYIANILFGKLNEYEINLLIKAVEDAPIIFVDTLECLRDGVE